MPGIEETIAFIVKAHAGQTDKSGRDYHHHPIAVMQRLTDCGEDLRLAALLHDVLEDTPYTRQDLAAMGYSARALDIVEQVTKVPGDKRTYAEKIAALIALGDADVMRLKLADMSENMDPERLALLAPEKQAFFLEKYSAPLAALRAALSGLSS